MPFKRIFIFLLIAALNTLVLHAQVFDNFSDGNFTQNPEWFGDDSLFTINSNFDLQSRGTPGTAKDIQLATESALLLNTEFSILARFNLNPSTQNFSRFYLASDSLNLKGNINGYYIQFGGHTGTTDSVVLFKQTGTTRTAILSSRAGIVGKNANIIRIKILVDMSGEFSLFTDTTGNFDFVFEGRFKDNAPHLNSLFSGVFARFTSSNVGNYFFDDVYIGPERIDLDAPILTAILVQNDTVIDLQYNERLYADAANVNRFLVNGSIARQASFISQNNSAIRLICQPLINGSNNSLEILAIKDINNNAANDTLINFLFFEPNENDIVISELMPDPEPPVNLPNAEYVEIYNNTPFEINLQGWTLSDPGATAVLGNITLKPDSFLIICPSTQAQNFAIYGRVAAVSNFPTLNNSGDQLWLRNRNGKIINYLSYTTVNYNNPSKANGGFSMELINPNEICKGTINWLASEHPDGGTPGTYNTIFRKNKDAVPPQIVFNDFTDSVNFIVVFNEHLLQNAIPTFNLFNNSVERYRISNDTFYIQFLLPFEPNTVLNITINNLADCIGNIGVYNISKPYIPAEIPFQNDLVVSEIMHSPSVATALPNEEYIELFNRSKKAINLKGCILTDNTGSAILPEYKLYPDSFVVLCNLNRLTAFNGIRNVIGVRSLPTFSSNDKVVIYNNFGYLVHGIKFEANWHRDGFKQSVGGYSIEMIDVNNPCAGAINWRASNNPNGGTPGFKNSVSGENNDNAKPEFLRVYTFNEKKLRLYFNETLDSFSISKNNFQFSNTNITLIDWRFINDSYSAIELELNEMIQQNETYKLIINKITDCVGNKMNDDQDEFALLYKPDSGDVVINEVLFQPKSGGSDFVELYNLTDKFIDLKSLMFANTIDRQINTLRIIANEGYMLKPKGFVSITDNPDFIIKNYNVKNKKDIFWGQLPSMNNTSGSIVLLDSNNTWFDALFYTDKMHHPLLTNKAGVSLEKVNPFIGSDIEGNWQSASAASGFATPAYQNSQYFTRIGSTSNKQHITITPEVFYPSRNSNNSVIEFNITLPEPGYNLKLDIINGAGQPITSLIGYANAGTENILYWNGIANNQKVPVGIYIAYVEAIHPNGNLIKEKQTFVVAD